MARIPDAELERLRREVSVQRLVEAHGVELKRHGKDFIGRCPFHADKTPSLVVTPQKNLWHCLGACGIGGGPIDWVQKAEGVSFRHAVELLRKDAVGFSPLAAEGKPALKESTVRKLAPPVTADAEDAAVLSQVAGYYHETLKEAPEAKAYLKSRGLESSAAVETFHLGFANRTLGLRLPMANRIEGAKLRGRLQTLGILRESGHEHFNGSLVVPLFNEAGETVGMYGRKVTENLRPGTPLHLYLPGPHRGVFNLSGLRGNTDVILCEALLDALTFWVAGFTVVTSAYGVEGFTKEVEDALVASGAKRVLIAFDRDEAGDTGAEKAARRLEARGLAPYRVEFPRGLDANAYALKVTPAQKSLGLVLSRAAWMGTGKKPAQAFSSLAAPPELELARAGVEIHNPAEPANGALTVTAAPTNPTELALANTVLTAATVPPPAETLAPAAMPPAPAGADAPAMSPTPSPSPNSPKASKETKDEGDVIFTYGPRRYRVRGLGKGGLDSLRVNVLVSAEDGRMHVDSLDLYVAKARAAFVHQAAVELATPEDTLKREVGQLLLALETRAEEARRAATAPKAKGLSDAECTAALELLHAPDLLTRISDALTKVGLVGEDDNKLLAYLAATSRKLEKPLAVVVQSSSAAGKSSLVEAVLALIPEEERIAYSAMTGQSLFYLDGADLKHKVLSIAEEEGASRATYALKLLQSEGQLTIASTGKDEKTGKLVTQTYRVEGPISLFLTTTKAEVDEELLNRCLVLSVDEGVTQTKAIHRRQAEAETLNGLLRRKEKDAVVKLFQDAQRLLRPLAVVNPFAASLEFSDVRTRARRDFPKLLSLMQALAFLHQHQREVKEATTALGEVVSYVEVTQADVEVAKKLLHSVLARAQDDMPPQTRRLLSSLETWAEAQCTQRKESLEDFRFSRRDVREALRWGDTQLKIHLARLVELELLHVHRAGNGGGFLYQPQWEGRSAENEGGRGAVGGRSAPEADRLSEEKPPFLRGLNDEAQLGRPNGHARPGHKVNGATSYVQAPALEARAVVEA